MFTFNICDSDIDDCTPKSCANGGTCVDGVDDYSCQCAEGFNGDNCETSKSLNLELTHNIPSVTITF